MKYAFVTGGGRGLGKGFVDYLIDQDYFVFAGVSKLKSEYKNSEKLMYVFCDLASDESISECANEISTKTDRLDLIVNNAGVNKESATDDHKELVCNLDKVERKYLLDMININSISPLIVTQKLLPLLKVNPSFVVNISSCRASFHDEFENNNANYGYAGSKIALNMFTFGMAKELPKNVKTFAVHPGSVKTDMNKSGDQTPYDQARNIINICDNWKDEYNGKFMRWSGEKYPL